MTQYPIDDGLSRRYPNRGIAVAQYLLGAAAFVAFGSALWIDTGLFGEGQSMWQWVAPTLTCLSGFALIVLAATSLHRGVVVSSESVHNPFHLRRDLRNLRWADVEDLTVRISKGDATLRVEIAGGRISRVPLGMVHAPVALQRDVARTLKAERGVSPKETREWWTPAMAKPAWQATLGAGMAGGVGLALAVRLLDETAGISIPVWVALGAFCIGAVFGALGYRKLRARSLRIRLESDPGAQDPDRETS